MLFIGGGVPKITNNHRESVSIVSAGSGRLSFTNGINAMHWKELNRRCYCCVVALRPR